MIDINTEFTIDELMTIKHMLGIRKENRIYRNGYVLNHLISPSPVGDLVEKGVVIMMKEKTKSTTDKSPNSYEFYVHQDWVEEFSKLFNAKVCL
jgi:hypothetical protein